MDNTPSSSDSHIIKTALELALEKLKAEPVPSGDSAAESIITEGRRLAAAYLRGEKPDIKKLLKGFPAKDRSLVVQGMRDTFLLNIVLPRTEIAHKECRRSLEGLAQALDNDPALLQACAQVENICKEYLAQFKQMQKQMQQAFKEQAEMLQERAAAQTGMDIRISPEQLPEFQKQWQAQLGQLNEYYGQAIDEIKTQLRTFTAQK
jgi:hypothetical protein